MTPKDLQACQNLIKLLQKKTKWNDLSSAEVVMAYQSFEWLEKHIDYIQTDLDKQRAETMQMQSAVKPLGMAKQEDSSIKPISRPLAKEIGPKKTVKKAAKKTTKKRTKRGS
jgi:hypothetical protein